MPITAGFGGGLLGVFALLTLGSTALHATTTQRQDVTHRAEAAATRQNEYFSCLEAQAHSLVGQRDVVYLAEANLGRWVTITKVVGGWANVTLHRSRATVALEVVHRSGGNTCAGDVLISIRHTSDGGVLMRRGHSSGPGSS